MAPLSAMAATALQWHHCQQWRSNGMGMAMIATLAEMAVNAVAEEVDC